MQPVKNRNIEHTPIRTYTKSSIWDPTTQALFYILDKKKFGSSGGQENALELGPYGCIVDTHKNYPKRSEFSIMDVSWLIIDKDKIQGNRENEQYDKNIHKMIMDYDDKVSISPYNDDVLQILEGYDEKGKDIYRSLTQNEYIEYLDNIFSEIEDKEDYPLDTNQIDIVKNRHKFHENNNDADFILDIESCHTRLGKDKVNAKGIRPTTQVVFDISGYFGTWQIVKEFGKNEIPVYTRGKSKERILREICDLLKDNKRPWVMISTYNNEDSERIDLLKLFKNANIQIIADEVDYQMWKQAELLGKMIENVIS